MALQSLLKSWRMKLRASLPLRSESPNPQDAKPSVTYEEWRDQFTLDRLRVLYILGLIANPFFIIIDVLLYRDHLYTLLIIRAIMEVGFLFSFLGLRQQISFFKPHALLAFWILYPNVCLAQMTVELGGFTSTYYSGLNLVFLAAGVIVPAFWKSHLVAQLGTLLYYYGANFLQTITPLSQNAALENSFFLVWTCVAVLFSVYLYERLQRAELQARESEREVRKELEASNKKLVELDRLKSEFFANISHELRTPLTLVLGTMKALKKVSQTAESHGLLDSGVRNSSRLLLLINELLDLAKFESGRAKIDKRSVDLTAIVRGVAANFQSFKDRRIHFRGLTGPVPLEGDASQLKKVVYNLLSNAFKFSDREEGQVWIKLSQQDDEIQLEFEDNGIGIPTEQLHRIFDRFTQVEGSATRRYEGTGIGLALVKEIVTLHGGRIQVESKAGEGSTFTISLPRGSARLEDLGTADEEDDTISELFLAHATSIPTEEIPTESLPKDQPRVLVVDDNSDLRTYLARMLKPHYSVTCSRDGQEALELAQSVTPDLILTDVMMPRMSGHDLLKAVRNDERLAKIPVVFLTARAGTEARVESLEAGADDYIPKPFDESEVLARVANLIRSRNQERQLIELQKEKLSRFLPPHVAELVLSDAEGDFLKGHRQQVTVLFVDLRGFTALSESADPEDVIAVLREYQAEMGRLITEYEGTLEKFSGDSIMVFLNDPQPVPNHQERATRMAVAMVKSIQDLHDHWGKRGYELGAGIGIATGYATLGLIGFENRNDYAAIGPVTNLAARLCAEAQHGQILVPEKFFESVSGCFIAQPVGNVQLKGFRNPIAVHNITGIKG